MPPDPAPATKPRPVRSAIAAGLRALLRFCWDCVFPPPAEDNLPPEFKSHSARALEQREQARQLSEWSRNMPRWPP